MEFKLSPWIMLKKMTEETVYAIDINSPSEDLIKFEETSSFLLQLLTEKRSLEYLVDQVLNEFDEENSEKVEEDVFMFLQHLKSLNYIEVHG